MNLALADPIVLDIDHKIIRSGTYRRARDLLLRIINPRCEHYPYWVQTRTCSNKKKYSQNCTWFARCCCPIYCEHSACIYVRAMYLCGPGECCVWASVNIFCFLIFKLRPKIVKNKDEAWNISWNGYFDEKRTNKKKYNTRNIHLNFHWPNLLSQRPSSHGPKHFWPN